MEVPDLVADQLGEEQIQAGVNLGDEDAVCLTETRTIVYRGEGLISDESVTVLPHDVERLDVSEGRRKSTFTLTYVDDQRSFGVPNNRVERVLELVLEGVLAAAEVTDDGESVRGVYRFSELTLIVTDGRLVKHVGAHVWDDDYEEFPFADVTGLAFEEGSVATQIVLSVEGRPQRIKAPNDEAPKLRRTLEEALFAFHDVESVTELNEAVGEEPEADEPEPTNHLTLDAGIDPLVGGDDDDREPAAGGTESGEASGAADPDGRAEASTESRAGGSTDANAGSAANGAPGATADAEGTEESPADPEVPTTAEVADRLEALTSAVKRQNQLLRKQHKTLERLIEELRQSR